MGSRGELWRYVFSSTNCWVIIIMSLSASCVSCRSRLFVCLLVYCRETEKPSTFAFALAWLCSLPCLVSISRPLTTTTTTTSNRSYQTPRQIYSNEFTMLWTVDWHCVVQSIDLFYSFFPILHTNHTRCKHLSIHPSIHPPTFASQQQQQ